MVGPNPVEKEEKKGGKKIKRERERRREEEREAPPCLCDSWRSDRQLSSEQEAKFVHRTRASLRCKNPGFPPNFEMITQQHTWSHEQPNTQSWDYQGQL